MTHEKIKRNAAGLFKAAFNKFHFLSQRNERKALVMKLNIKHIKSDMKCAFSVHSNEAFSPYCHKLRSHRISKRDLQMSSRLFQEAY
ncbi:CLUMA_CG008945, isoform A [Clunio marinus]|uniref:CLUMA_CG008945, isoform A n=1 Tax=Clunio marinus TaxID=568069 RepID=A0A1J1I7C1_9DIPT|nr:CLUMA_CG008945, isoform A [Clunio marinus]